MKFNITTFAARSDLKATGVDISLGNVHQVLAAGLGYKSLAALQASSEEQPGLEGAEFVVFDVDAMSKRCAELGHAAHAQVVISALHSGLGFCSNPPTIYHNEKDFIEDEVYMFAATSAPEDDAVNTASANTNAYISDACVECGDEPDSLNDANGTWNVPVHGNVNMDQDPDRTFCGDNILIEGFVRVQKVGRRCLSRHMELDIDASVDESFYEDAFSDKEADEIANR